jgi:hypothetical protein
MKRTGFTNASPNSKASSGGQYRRAPSFFTIKGIEKLIYLVGVPVLIMYGGFKIYKKNLVEGDERALRIEKVETKYLQKNASNMVKL